MNQMPLLSIIIPVFNEERRLTTTFEKLAAFVKDPGYAIEVIVVDNASTDRTKDIVMSFASRYTFIKYLYKDVTGKGATVRAGIRDARGDYLLICDADLAVPIEEVGRFLPLLLQDYDIAIGSREAEGARRYGEPFHRYLMGRVFNFIVRKLLLPCFHDTQCGFKCFRRDVAHDLFSINKIDGWGFDVEILYIAQLKNYRIAEVPVHWYYGEGSKVSPARDTWRILKEILEIRRNRKKGLYPVSPVLPLMIK